MGWEMPLLVVPFILTAFGTMLLAGEAWRRSRSPGRVSFAFMMLMIITWLIALAGNLLSTSPAQKIYWAKVTYFGVAWLPTLWLTFSLESL